MDESVQMSTQSELAFIFLLAGLGLVLIVFLVIALIIYAWQRSKKRRVHIENVTITNKNFDSQSRYSKTDSNEYIASHSPGFALTHHFHHGLEIPKKIFEAPSAPLTPPSSSSPTVSDTTDAESKAHNPVASGSLRSVVVVDDNETEPIGSLKEGSKEEPKKDSSADTSVVPAIVQYQKRSDLMPISSSRERNVKIEIPESRTRQSVSAGGKRDPYFSENAGTPRRFSRQMEKLQEQENERLYSEFDNLNQQLEAKPSNEGQTLKNIRRNRYYDIVPYDENRVKLAGLANDYINASYIQNPENKEQIAFIAAQGPIDESETVGGRREQTVADFWHMIWQEKIDCVVMLTQCVENKKQKCAKYWPKNVDENEPIDDELSMNLYCYIEDEICFTREIWLEKNNEGTRKVTQWHYKNWKDTEGPDCNESFLNFIGNIRKSTKRSPILVHCSAGVGRTGVYIGLDLLLNKLESEQIINVYETALTLRKARPNMIQNYEQYLTLYELIAIEIRRKFETNGD